MADDVLINFVGDTTGLQPVDDALDGLIQKEGEVGAAWKKTSDIMNDQSKQSADNTNKLAKSIDQLAAATKSMDKAVIGGAYKQYLKEIQAQLGLTSKELIAYIQNARKAAQAQIITSQDQKEVDELNLSIQVMNDQLKELGATEDQTAEKTSSLRARLREAKEELAGLIENGITSGPVFETAKEKAGALDDQMRDLNQTVRNVGSDTKKIDGLISLATGVAGGFAIAQGAVALFGSENEDMQRALLKVNAAMAILQGLQQVQNVLQKESAASLLFTTNARKANAAAIVTETVVTEGQVVATEAATVAQTELNTAMALNPVGLIIIAVLAAITALTLFSEAEETAAEKTERLTKEAEDLYEALIKIAKVNQFEIDRNIQIEKNKVLIDQLDAQGGSLVKINDLKKKNLALDNQNLAQELNAIEAGKEKAEDKTQFIERELAVKTKIYQNDQAQLLLDIELNKVLLERSLKSAASDADATVAKRRLTVLQNQVDSIASINAITEAEIIAIRKREAEQLNAERLTQGEINKIRADANLKVLELQKNQQKKLLEIQKSDITAKLTLAQKGSEEEFNLKIKQLQKSMQIELQQEELTQQQINEIKAKYKVQEEELTRKFAEQRIENEISFLNSYIDAFGISEERKLELTLRRLDRQRDLEISQAEGNAAKIKEINAKYDKIILDSKKAAIKAELDEKLKALDVYTHQAVTAANKTLGNDNSTLAQKKAASDKLLQIDLDRIKEEEAAVEKSKPLITKEAYLQATQDIANKRADAEIAAQERVTAAIIKEADKQVAKLQSVFGLFERGITAVFGNTAFAGAVKELEGFASKTMKILADLKAGTIKTMEAVKQIAAAAVTAAQVVINQIFADASAKRQQIVADEIAALEEQKQKELSALNLTKQQQADIEARYRQRERKIKIDAFNADKEAKRSQALINGALGATLAFAEYAWPYSLIVAGIIAALTAVEISEINRQQPPRFKTGKVNIDGPGTPTSDSIHAMISKGESVINADSTKKWPDALEAINAGRFDQYLTDKLNQFIYPEVPEYITTTAGGMAIDYNLFARAVAREMKGVIPAPSHIHNNFDKDGFHSYVEQGNSRTEYKNRRYTVT